MDNDMTEYVLWPKLPSTEDFCFFLSFHFIEGLAEKKEREIERYICETARGKWSRDVECLIQ